MTKEEKIKNIREQLRPLNEKVSALCKELQELEKAILEQNFDDIFKNGITLENSTNNPDPPETYYKKIKKFLHEELPGLHASGYIPALNQLSFNITFEIYNREAGLTLEKGIESLKKILPIIKPFPKELKSGKESYAQGCKYFPISTPDCHFSGIPALIVRDDNTCRIMFTRYGSEYIIQDFKTLEEACKHIWDVIALDGEDGEN